MSRRSTSTCCATPARRGASSTGRWSSASSGCRASKSASVARVAVMTGGGRVLSLLRRGARADPRERVDERGRRRGRAAIRDRINANVIGPGFFRRSASRSWPAAISTTRTSKAGRRSSSSTRRWSAMHFAGEDPIGKRVSFDGPAGAVARDRRRRARQQVRRRSARTPLPVAYLPVAQNHETGMTLYVRASVPPASLVAQPPPRDPGDRAQPAGARHPDDDARRSARRSTPRAWARGCWRCSAAWRCCSPPSASTACCRSRSRAAPARWASGWRSARTRTGVFLLVVRDGMLLVGVGILSGWPGASPARGRWPAFSTGAGDRSADVRRHDQDAGGRGAGRMRDPGATGHAGESDHGAPSRVRRGQKSGSVARPNLVGDPVLPESERTLSPAAPGRLTIPRNQARRSRTAEPATCDRHAPGLPHPRDRIVQITSPKRLLDTQATCPAALTDIE